MLLKLRDLRYIASGTYDWGNNAMMYVQQFLYDNTDISL